MKAKHCRVRIETKSKKNGAFGQDPGASIEIYGMMIFDENIEWLKCTPAGLQYFDKYVCSWQMDWKSEQNVLEHHGSVSRFSQPAHVSSVDVVIVFKPVIGSSNKN